MQEDNYEKDIAERIEQMKLGKAHAYFLGHLDYPTLQRDKDKADIVKMIARIEKSFPDLKKLIKTIRKDFEFIWTQTEITAAYLLLGKAASNLETALDLAKEGKNLEIMDVARAGQESVDLVTLFLEESGKPLLEKWFKGETVGHKYSRAALDERLNTAAKEAGDEALPIAKMTAHMYDIYSKYTHGTYGALLDAVDVFHQDFDFEKNAGYHYTKENFHVIDNLFSIIALQLKNVFLKLESDERFGEADRLYKAINVTRTPLEEIKKIMEKYRAKEGS